MPGLANIVRVTSTTTGTGTLTLGSAVSGFLTPVQAGMTSGATFSYAIEADYVTVGDDLVATSREVGTGTYTSPSTLTRSVINSTNSNALLDLTGDEEVIIAFIATAAGDVSILGTTVSSSVSTGALVVAGGVGISNGRLNIGLDNATGNDISEMMRLVKTTSGTPAQFHGAEIAFEIETTAGNELGGRFQCYAVDATSGSEDFAFAFKCMTGGAAANNKVIISGLASDYILAAGDGSNSTVIRAYGNNSAYLHLDSDSSATIRVQFGAVEATNRGELGTVSDVPFSLVSNNTERFRVDNTGFATLQPGIATPAGGATTVRLVFGTTSGFGIYVGSGAPTVTAAQGSIYLRSDGSSTSTRLYVNTTGAAVWTNFTSAT